MRHLVRTGRRHPRSRDFSGAVLSSKTKLRDASQEQNIPYQGQQILRQKNHIMFFPFSEIPPKSADRIVTQQCPTPYSLLLRVIPSVDHNGIALFDA